MKKIGFLLATVVMLVLFAFSASAKTEGYYTYEVENGEATITDVSTSISGDVVIPDDLGGYPVTSIGDYAFEDCTSLTSISIPDSVTSIGSYAFYNCTSLTSISIPDSVTSIYSSAFYNCTSLTNISIPDGVTSISYAAFRGCTSLTSITIPDSVTSIGLHAFDGCSSLTSITVDTDNEYYSSDSRGVLYDKNKKELIRYPEGNKVTTYIIPDSVTSIGSSAFGGCTSLTSITLPFVGASQDGTSNTHFGYIFGASSYSYNNNYVPGSLKEVIITAPCKKISSSAFYNCTSLTSITIPDSVTSIGPSAFYGCKGLKDISIPEGVTTIGEKVFYNCTSLTSITISDNVTSIGPSAFYGCKGLKDISIPEGVTTIGEKVFYNCTSLTSITIPDNVTSIGSSAFYGCKGLKDISIPEGVTTIGEKVFYNCTSLASITIPDSVTSIGGYAFYNCDGLSKITLPGSIEAIGNSVFYDCDSLQSITIPDSVKSIGNYAFYSCGSLRKIVIPDSVESIGSEAFYLAFLSAVTIGENVTSIGTRAFDTSTVIYTYDGSCAEAYAEKNKNKTVLLEKADIVNGKIGSRFSWTLDKKSGVLELTGSGKLPDFMNAEAPWHCYQAYITSVNLPDGLTKIGYGSFMDLFRLKSVTIPQSVTEIGTVAFSGCCSLENIVIPDSVTSLGSSAFNGCSALSEIKIGNGVKTIDSYVFVGCDSLKAVTIPDSVTSIGVSAFRNCSSLEKVTIGNGVTTIGDSAFYNCDALVNVTFGNSVTTMNNYAFFDCDSLSSVVLPDSMLSIGSDAFYSCNNLKQVHLGNNLIRMYWSAFGRCTKLKKIEIPASVVYIKDGVFADCVSLEEVIFKIDEKNQSKITAIPNNTFYGCKNLKNIVFPASVKSISGTLPAEIESITVYNPECVLSKGCGLNYNHTIIGFKGSTAEKFADEIAAEFIDIETVHTHAFKTIERIDDYMLQRCVCGKEKSSVTTKITAAQTNNSVTLYWKKLANVTGYRIYLYNKGWKAIKTTGALNYTVTGLTAGTSYRFAVKAYTKNGTTTIWAPKFSEIKTATAPVPPTTVKQTAGTDKTVTVKWDACKNATGYRVYKYNSSTKKWETVVKATAKLTAKISGLSANRQYYIAVKPYTKTESGYVWGTAFTKILVGTAPATPTVKLASTSKGRATIAWNNVAGEKGYQVYYSTSATSGFKKISNYNADIIKAYKTGLTSGQTYYFKVRSYRVYNGVYVYSPYSSVKSVTIK